MIPAILLVILLGVVCPGDSVRTSTDLPVADCHTDTECLWWAIEHGLPGDGGPY